MGGEGGRLAVDRRCGHVRRCRGASRAEESHEGVEKRLKSTPCRDDLCPTDFQRGKTLDGQNLSGQLSDWSINDLLQIMQVTKKTGSLEIEGERRGRIHFRDGEVTGADLTGSRQTYVAEDRSSVADVLYVLSSLDKGSFAVGSAEVPDGDSWSVEEVLADVESLAELEASVAESGLIEAAGIRLTGEVEEAITLDRDDWQVIVGLVQPFTFAHLESRFGRGGAVRVLHTLHRLEVAEPITSEDESQFLDRLAEGISSDSSEPTWLEAQKGNHEKDEESVPVVALEAVEDEGDTPDEEPIAVEDEPEERVSPKREPIAVRGVSADASTTLTDGVYDEIRRLRSKASEK
ncbi:MAG: DUF4388 domain-containing protein [Acidimicrobiia bacterium]